MPFANIFSQCLACLFILLRIMFLHMENHLFFFYLLVHLLPGSSEATNKAEVAWKEHHVLVSMGYSNPKMHILFLVCFELLHSIHLITSSLYKGSEEWSMWSLRWELPLGFLLYIPWNFRALLLLEVSDSNSVYRHWLQDQPNFTGLLINKMN